MSLILMLSVLLALMTTLALALVVVCGLVSWKSYKDSEKLSPFECGFMTKGLSRGYFSVHFFLVALIFVIFDIELVILFPMLLGQFYLLSQLYLTLFILVLTLLTVGLFIEWGQSMLEWST